MPLTDNLLRRLTSRTMGAIAFTCLLSWAFTYLSISIFEDYAVGLFIGLPISIGALSTLIYGYRYPSQRSVLRNISFLSLLVYCLGLLVFAWEGLICLIMAAPIGLFFTWLGHLA
ncbi:MAG TPA: hypothetical protein VD794_00620, partial [Flavisolibacter sp.]|nr:hypothetical protein [Flavisolibacter sp.]